MGNVSASFYGSYLRTLGSVAMRAMSTVIDQLEQAGEPELARELRFISQLWTRAVRQRASSFAPTRPRARATEHSLATVPASAPSDVAKAAHAAVERLRCKTLVMGMREVDHG